MAIKAPRTLRSDTRTTAGIFPVVLVDVEYDGRVYERAKRADRTGVIVYWTTGDVAAYVSEPEGGDPRWCLWRARGEGSGRSIAKHGTPVRDLDHALALLGGGAVDAYAPLPEGTRPAPRGWNPTP